MPTKREYGLPHDFAARLVNRHIDDVDTTGGWLTLLLDDGSQLHLYTAGEAIECEWSKPDAVDCLAY